MRAPRPNSSETQSDSDSAAVSREERARMRAIDFNWFNEVWIKGNLSYIEQARHPECVSHGLHSDPLDGTWDFARFFTAVKSAIPEISISCEHLLVQPPFMATAVIVSGAHLGYGLGVPPTGRRLEFSLFGLRRIADGRMIESWNALDRFHLYRQIGVGLTLIPHDLFPPFSPDPSVISSGSTCTPGDDDLPESANGSLTAGRLDSWFDAVWHGDAISVSRELASNGEGGILRARTIHPGVEGFARMRAIFKAAFPDIRCRVVLTVIDGSTAAVQVNYSGTHTGAGLAVLPTNRAFSVGAQYLMRFRYDHVVDLHGIVDLCSLFRQLGLLLPLAPEDLTRQTVTPPRMVDELLRDPTPRNILVPIPLPPSSSDPAAAR